MSRIIPSIYSYDRESTIQNTTISNQPINNLPATGEKIIIALLQKYGFLSSPLLQRYINLRKHGTINVKKSLRKLQEQGKVEKYTITHSNDVADIDVYVLSNAERKKYKIRSIYRFDMMDIPYILEHLSIAQWHVSMLEGKGTKEVAYYKQINAKGFITQLQSVVQIKNVTGRNMILSAITIPKGIQKQDIASLFTTIITTDNYFRDRKSQYNAYVIVLICESESQIEQISQMLTKMAETTEIYIIYSLDTLSADDTFDPLSTLYDVKREEGETELSVLKLRG